MKWNVHYPLRGEKKKKKKKKTLAQEENDTKKEKKMKIKIKKCRIVVLVRRLQTAVIKLQK